MPGNDDIQLIVGREDVSAIAEAVSWSAVDPGGFEAASMQFPRNVRIPRGTDVKILYGNGTAWEGRVNEVNRQLSAQPVTQLACQGYGARYKENGGSMIFVDRDTSRWTGPSRSRQISDGATFVFNDWRVAQDPTSANPALILTFNNANGLTPMVDTLYDAGPDNKIASMYYDFTVVNLTPPDANLFGSLQMSDDDANAVNPLQFSILTAIAGSGYWTPGGGRRYAHIQMYYNATTLLATREYDWIIRNPTLFGDHKMVKRGPDPGGFFPTDIASYVQGAAFPATRIDAGIIEPSTYVIPHMVYYTAVPWEQMIADAATFAGFHYGTWEGPALHFRSYPGSPTCWTDSRSVDDLQINDSLDGLFNVAKIAYHDAAGSNGVVICTRSVAALDDANIPRTLYMDIGVGTATSATAFGNIVLAISERNASTTGSFVTKLPIITTGGDRPAFMLRPGIDRLKVTDLTADGDGQTEFILKRIEASVDSDGINTNVELGRGADLIQTLQARLQSGLTPLGLG